LSHLGFLGGHLSHRGFRGGHLSQLGFLGGHLSQLGFLGGHLLHSSLGGDSGFGGGHSLDSSLGAHPSCATWLLSNSSAEIAIGVAKAIKTDKKTSLFTI
jgi:hypothetical protein